MDEKQSFLSVLDFFNNDTFIAWRLFRTEELDAYWANFLKENPQAGELLQEASRNFDAVKLNDKKLPHNAEEELYVEVRRRIAAHTKIKKRQFTYWLSAVACVALIIVSATFLVMREKTQPLVTQNEIVGKTLPGEDVQLISGNKTISLESNSSITLSDEGQASVTDSTQNKKAIHLAENQLNKLIVPYGKRSFITLSDGTKVWLNSGTELNFPASFRNDSRNIRVKGEIYIEVAKSERPFLVYTDRSVIRVMGTKFNISAYDDDMTESVVLVEGRVKISTKQQPAITLTPNEMAVISIHGIEKKNVDISEYISWRNGLMEFNKTSMAEVLKKIGRYYNVSFENNMEIPLNEKTVSGKLFLSNNLDSVMTSVSILSSTSYKRENNHIVIHKK